MSSRGKVSGAQAINHALYDALEQDGKVIFFGEDVGDRQGGGVLGCSRGLSTKFGESRVRSTPISEQAIVGAAIGASMAGLRPVAEIMLMNFATVAMDMIVNHAAKLRYMSGGQTGVPITIRMATGAGFRHGGQHSDFLEAWFAHTPGLKVVIPSNPADAYGLLLSCIFDDDPCLFVEPIGMYHKSTETLDRGKRIPLGKAAIVRPGKDLTLITYGSQVEPALAVAQKLKDQIDVEVIDLRTVAPFDEPAILESVSRTGRAVVLHEAVKRFGVGAEISARITESMAASLKSPVARIGAGFSPVPFAAELEAAFFPQLQEIEAVIRRTYLGEEVG